MIFEHRNTLLFFFYEIAFKYDAKKTNKIKVFCKIKVI